MCYNKRSFVHARMTHSENIIYAFNFEIRSMQQIVVHSSWLSHKNEICNAQTNCSRNAEARKKEEEKERRFVVPMWPKLKFSQKINYIVKLAERVYRIDIQACVRL